MFKKIVIADSLAPLVNEIFNSYQNQPGQVLIMGAVLFAFQIYGDFSGYSDVARGISKLLGIELMVNFNMPYFSRSIGEFWRRWHISLSTWFRDYVYIPLGGSREGKLIGIRNVFIIFVVSGLWHGANWTFIVWGLIHSLLFIPSFLVGNNRFYSGDLVNQGSWLPSISSVLRLSMTFISVTLAWVFFRSESLGNAIEYLTLIPQFSEVIESGVVIGKKIPIYLILLIGIEYLLMRGIPKPIVRLRWFFYVLAGIIIYSSFLENQEAQFIYFQF